MPRRHICSDVPQRSSSAFASRPPARECAAGTVPAQSRAGRLLRQARPAQDDLRRGQQRANIPTWSSLIFADGGQPFSATSGQTTGWSQSLDLHTGIITTSATWKARTVTPPALYRVLADRANYAWDWCSFNDAAAVERDRDRQRPDRRNAGLADRETAKAFNPVLRQVSVAVTTKGTGIEAAIASQLTTSSNVTALPTETNATTPGVGQLLNFGHGQPDLHVHQVRQRRATRRTSPPRRPRWRRPRPTPARRPRRALPRWSAPATPR